MHARAPQANQSLISASHYPSDGLSSSGHESAEDEPRNSAHISNLKVPIALRSSSVLSSRSRMPVPPTAATESTRLTLNKLALKGSAPHLRPGKSLQQRLNANERRDDDSEVYSAFSKEQEYRHNTPVKVQDSQVPRLPRSHTPRPEPRMPAAHSRSVSVVSGMAHDEDISSIMMRGATDLRNTKFEIEEQRKEISFLQSQLESAKAEKKEALQRVKAVKEAAKQGLEKSSKSLDDMRTTLDSLKTQASESFAIVGQAKMSFSDVQDLRETVLTSLKSIEPLLDDDGHSFQAEEMRNVIKELQTECTNSHQVTDLLRDRLQTIGDELVDARNRTVDVEQQQASDREAIRSLSNNLSEAGQQVAELTGRLKEQQSKSYDILLTAADVEARLSASNQENARLIEELTSKNAEIATLRLFEQRSATLAATLQEKDVYISQLEPLKEQLSNAISTSNALESKLCALESEFSAKESHLNALQSRISEQEAESQVNNNELLGLKEILGASNATGDALRKQNAKLVGDAEALDIKVTQAQNELRDLRKDLEIRTEKLHQANTRYQVMEERFQDQSVTLRITKESLGDMQDRIIESEAKFAREIEATAGTLKCEIAVLTTQNSSLREKIEVLEDVVKSKEEEIQCNMVAYGKQLKDQEKTLTDMLNNVEKRFTVLEKDLAEAQLGSEQLKQQLADALAAHQDIEQQLRNAKIVPEAHQEEISELTRRLNECNQEVSRLHARTKTIGARYKNGDLNDEERAFTNSLIQTSQSIHEQELIAKGNELRRRDNTIAELRSRINLLEATLAKHLKSQAKAQVTTGGGNGSLIDPTSWTSSDRSSSPFVPANAANEAEPQDGETNTSKPASDSSRRPILGNMLPPVLTTPLQASRPADVYRPSAIQVPRTPAPVAIRKTPATNRSAHSPSKPIFGRLARGCSDDIEEFEPELSPLSPPPVKLGKRSKPDAPSTPANARSPPRQTKRLRVGTRNRPEGRANEPVASKVVEAAPKTRARRKR
ncbi:unnamed protein product [Somion occarium]|uniref:Uncharacterized protein n=1 Tax=Somion occarium TaxID=3059160 RepID=A0ABP1CYQ7_9APHY